MLINRFGDFRKPDEEEFEVKVPGDDTYKRDRQDAGHASAEGKTYQENHDDIGVVVFDLKLCRFHGFVHVFLHFLVAGPPLIQPLHKIIIKWHVRVRTDSHNKPS